MKVKSEIHFETPWTAAYQAPPSMGFSLLTFSNHHPDNNEVTIYDPVIPLLGIYLDKTIIQKIKIMASGPITHGKQKGKKWKQ